MLIKGSKNRYTTNHPKDMAARRMQSLQKFTKDEGCTKNQLNKPTEKNVQRCMRYMQETSGAGEQYKKDAKYLGENSDLNKHRRA